ncbi:fimbrial biogenesis outer membrane usher protein [Methylovorus glucosotrophus]|uniref:Fimbrial biogenesis outer membrane usher protein n=1 Tax=Methylovorus glucosotrophus (strain SIP3-4) TaxID=582744 RepID=C6X7U1_METGS|nr:fimbrial biogenesis outer membrane usher protein [Methylovorus glucosotrophus]ACT51268.1 fimbrial biogenesis outer membrane usher protein [Methylovorus glucosotrophus SIP3-4]
MHKKAIALLLMGLFNHAYADEIPYTLSIPYLTDKSIESLILFDKDKTYILESDIKQIVPNQQFEITKINGLPYIDVSTLGNINLDEDSLSANLLLKPELLPKQNYSLLATRYTIAPTSESAARLNYRYQYNTVNGLHAVALNPEYVFKDGDSINLDLNVSNLGNNGLVGGAYIHRDDKNNRIWNIGSLVSGRATLSNSVRFLGVQLQSNNDLNPTFQDRVSSSFNGFTEIPTVAELFINDQKILEKQLNPGEFFFENITNQITSDGNVKLLVKDVNGNVNVLTSPLLGNPKNLRKGVNAYSFESGLLRRSFDKFDTPFVSGTYSTGINDSLTLQGHYEASKDVQNVGVSSIYGTPYGTFTGGLSVGNGNIYNVGYFYSDKRVRLNVDYSKYVDYQSLGSLNNIRDDNRLSATANYRFDNGRSLNLSLVKSDFDTRASLGTSFRINKDWNVRATTNYSELEKLSVFVGFEYNFGGSWNVSSSFDSRNNNTRTELNNANNRLNNVNTRLGLNNLNGENSYFGSADYMNQYINVGANVSKTDIGLSSQGSVAGSVVFTKNRDVLFSRTINDGHVVVNIPDSPDVDIKLSNNFVAKTNSKGLAAFPISSLNDNNVSIDVKTLPQDKNIDNVDYKVNVLPQSAVSIDVGVLKAGFFLDIDTELQVLDFKGSEVFKTKQGFYIDGLAVGQYEIKVANDVYKFEVKNNTKEFDVIQVVKM